MVAPAYIRGAMTGVRSAEAGESDSVHGASIPPAEYRDSLLRGASWAAFCALVILQGYLALQLYGPDNAWSAMTDDAPITDGRHPLHLYHASLSAQAWHR